MGFPTEQVGRKKRRQDKTDIREKVSILKQDFEEWSLEISLQCVATQWWCHLLVVDDKVKNGDDKNRLEVIITNDCHGDNVDNHGKNFELILMTAIIRIEAMVTIKLTIVMIVIEPDCLGFVSCHLWKDLSSLNIWSTHTDQRNPLGTNGQIQWCTQRNPLVTNEQIQFWSSSSKSSKRFPLRKLIYNCNWYQIVLFLTVPRK